jgi:hypothetical protein
VLIPGVNGFDDSGELGIRESCQPARRIPVDGVGIDAQRLHQHDGRKVVQDQRLTRLLLAKLGNEPFETPAPYRSLIGVLGNVKNRWKPSQQQGGQVPLELK